MHYAKYNKSSVNNVLMHIERGIGEPDTHTHSNESIDPERTHLNYDLKDRAGLTAYQYYKQRIDDISAATKERTGKSIRKDAVTLCSWVVTVPKDLDPTKHNDFFQACYAWFSERYGEDNIVTAAVHLDETTPHLHLQFTPIVADKSYQKLCAKDIETPQSLKTAHRELQRHLSQALGCNVTMLNGATNNGNKSIVELKIDTLNQKLDEVNKQYEIAADNLKDVLDKKARASEIHKLFGDRETQSYHKNMLDSTRAIGNEAYNALIEANALKQQAVSLQNQAEQRLRDIAPYYSKAQKVYNQAMQEHKQAEQLRQSIDDEIHKQATMLASAREQRLRDYCKSIQFDDGTSVLDRFDEQERQRSRGKFKGR